MAKLANRAKMGTSTTGTGTITLGAAKSGFLSFADAGISNGNVVRYVIEDGDAFEIGTGTYTASGTTLTRTVTESSNSNNAINLSGNNEVSIFIAATKDDFVNAVEGGTFTGDVIFSGDITGDLTGTADKADQTYVQIADQGVQATHYILGMSGTASNGYKDVKYESGITFNPVTDSLSADSFRAKDGGFFAIQDSGGTYYTNLKAVGPTAFRDIYFPDADGTVAFNTTATTSSNGLMSSSDKTKLDGVETGATADQTDAEIKTAYEGNSDTNAFTDAEKTKLSGIETSADVTDTTNVTAAGALMDSELTNEAAVKAINQGLTTTSDVTFNDVVVSGDLTVSGTTTTINTETINLADNQIVFNSNETGSPTQDGGIEIERGTETNKTLVWDETNDRWTVGSETFVAGFFSGDGSNLTNVAASTVNVSESTDDNAFYNVLFSDTTGTGGVQMAPTQDDNGLTFNPQSNVLYSVIFQMADRIQHDGDTDTNISFDTDSITFTAGGVDFIQLIEGATDYVNVSTDLFLDTNARLVFEGSTSDEFETFLTVTDPTADRTITLPNATGTVALTSDLYTNSDVDTHLNQSSAGTNQILSWSGSDYAWVNDSDTTYSNATTSAAGLMSSSDKTKLDGIEASADVTDTTNVTAAGALMDSELTSEASVKAIDQGVATTDSPTFADLTLTDGVSLGGNVLPDTDNTGVVGNSSFTWNNGEFTNFKVTSTLTVRSYIDLADSDGIRFGSSDDSRFWYNGTSNKFQIEMESACLGHQWTNNGTEIAFLEKSTGNLTLSGTVDGRDVAADGTKLDGIEASADVTDTTNVTAAGALMDSELTDIASVKALNQGVATTDSPTFAAITIDGHTLQDSTNRSGLLQVDTDLGTWNGFSIASTGTSHWSIMGDQDDFGLYDDVNNDWIMLYNENSTLQLYSNGTNGLTVGPSYVDIPGQIRHLGDTDTYMEFHNANEWRVVTGGTERLEVTNSAITSVEPILAPSFEATSDINLKENIVKVESAVSKIQKLNGYTYNFKDEPEISKAGLIAQEVQEVLPEAVRVDKDSNLRLDYNGTIALLVEAIKDQQNQIDALRKKVEK